MQFLRKSESYESFLATSSSGVSRDLVPKLHIHFQMRSFHNKNKLTEIGGSNLARFLHLLTERSHGATTLGLGYCMTIPEKACIGDPLTGGGLGGARHYNRALLLLGIKSAHRHHRASAAATAAKAAMRDNRKAG